MEDYMTQSWTQQKEGSGKWCLYNLWAKQVIFPQMSGTKISEPYVLWLDKACSIDRWIDRQTDDR